MPRLSLSTVKQTSLNRHEETLHITSSKITATSRFLVSAFQVSLTASKSIMQNNCGSPSLEVQQLEGVIQGCSSLLSQ